MTYLILFILIIILVGYVLLYWSVNKGLISLKGAALMTLISLAAYLLFPILLKKFEIQSTTLLLFLFVLGGIAMVLFIEEKRRPVLKFNLRINTNMGKIKDVMDKMDMPEKIEQIKMGAKSIVGRIGERLNRLSYNVRENTEKQAKEGALSCKDNNVRNEEDMDIDDLLNDLEEDVSYVDFRKKSSKYESLFSPRHSKETTVGNNEGSQEQIDIQNQDVEMRGNQHSISTEEVETSTVTAAAAEDEPVDRTNENLEDDSEDIASKANIQSENGHDSKEAGDEEKKALTIEQCIDKAFLLKESGMLWEAIEYYIEALDKKPDDQLMLWIVVDICSLYKQQGKDEMAKEMMQSFIESFGEEMDEETRVEILRSI